MKIAEDTSRLFTLRIRPFATEPWITIHAFEGAFWPPNHTRVDVEVRQGGKVIFPRGTLWCGIPGHASLDGDEAKESVLSLVAMRPGDTDRDYFEGYTPEQLDWATHNGEALSMEREARYCDENGKLKGRRRRA